MFEGFSLTAFIIMTVLIAGGASYMTGRAIALTWRPVWQVVAYGWLLAAADRFFYFALLTDKIGEIAQTELLHPGYYGLNAAVIIGIGIIGHRITRVLQMSRQYPWMYKRTSPFSYKKIT